MKTYLFLCMLVLLGIQNAAAQDISIGGQSNRSDTIRSQQVEQIQDMIDSIEAERIKTVTKYETEITKLEAQLATLTPNVCPASQKLHWEGDRWVCLEDIPCEPRDCTLRTNAVAQKVTYAWHADSWSTCSTGTQRRIVTCLDSNGSIASDSSCSGTKPATSQSCDFATVLCAGTAIDSKNKAYCHLSDQTSVALKNGICSTSSSAIETYTLAPSVTQTCSYICSDTGDWLKKENNCEGL